MKHILIGTNRHQSNSEKIGLFVQKLYLEAGEEVELIRLEDLDLKDLHGKHYGSSEMPESVVAAVKKIDSSVGIICFVPEYNVSFPGVLKYFIDFWSYPQSFEHRPVCFIGLGGMCGGLRPVEHLGQVFGYRNSFVFPDRVFLMNVWKMVSPEGAISDPLTLSLMKSQVLGFQKFCRALTSAGLHANQIERKAK